jgi:hypothetical protein
MDNFSTRRQKGFDKKHKLNFDLTPLWCLEAYSLLYLFYISVVSTLFCFQKSKQMINLLEGWIR